MLEDFDLYINRILEIDDEIEFEIFNLFIEGKEKPILSDKLINSILEAYNTRKSIPIIRREYSFRIYDDLQLRGKFKCVYTSLEKAKKALKNYIFELLEKREKEFFENEWNEEEWGFTNHLEEDFKGFDFNSDYKKLEIFKKKLNKELEEAYIFQIENKHRCPICYSRKIYYRKEVKNYICIRCGTIISKNLQNVLRKKAPLICPLCEKNGYLRYRKRSDSYYCTKCKMGFDDVFEEDFIKANINNYLTNFERSEEENRKDIYKFLTFDESIKLYDIPTSFLCFLIDKFHNMTSDMFLFKATSNEYFDEFYEYFNLPINKDRKRSGRYLNFFSNNCIAKDTIYSLRQSRAFGCVKNLENRKKCKNLLCEQRSKKNPCNLKNNNVWASDYNNMSGSRKGWRFVEDYITRVIKVILNEKMIPINMILKILYFKEFKNREDLKFEKDNFRQILTHFLQDFHFQYEDFSKIFYIEDFIDSSIMDELNLRHENIKDIQNVSHLEQSYSKNLNKIERTRSVVSDVKNENNHFIFFPNQFGPIEKILKLIQKSGYVSYSDINNLLCNCRQSIYNLQYPYFSMINYLDLVEISWFPYIGDIFTLSTSGIQFLNDLKGGIELFDALIQRFPMGIKVIENIIEIVEIQDVRNINIENAYPFVKDKYYPEDNDFFYFQEEEIERSRNLKALKMWLNEAGFWPHTYKMYVCNDTLNNFKLLIEKFDNVNFCIKDLYFCLYSIRNGNIIFADEHFEKVKMRLIVYLILGHKKKRILEKKMLQELLNYDTSSIDKVITFFNNLGLKILELEDNDDPERIYLALNNPIDLKLNNWVWENLELFKDSNICLKDIIDDKIGRYWNEIKFYYSPLTNIVADSREFLQAIFKNETFEISTYEIFHELKNEVSFNFDDFNRIFNKKYYSIFENDHINLKDVISLISKIPLIELDYYSEDLRKFYYFYDFLKKPSTSGFVPIINLETNDYNKINLYFNSLFEDYLRNYTHNLELNIKNSSDKRLIILSVFTCFILELRLLVNLLILIENIENIDIFFHDELTLLELKDIVTKRSINFEEIIKDFINERGISIYNESSFEDVFDLIILFKDEAGFLDIKTSGRIKLTQKFYHYYTNYYFNWINKDKNLREYVLKELILRRFEN